jgi:hypothetical protein
MLKTDAEILAAGRAVGRALAAAAPLTDQQIAVLAALLLPVAGDDRYWVRLDGPAREDVTGSPAGGG